MSSLAEILAKVLLECHLQLRIAISYKKPWTKQILFGNITSSLLGVHCPLENTFYNE